MPYTMRSRRVELIPVFELIEVPGGHMMPWYNPELLITSVTGWLNSLPKPVQAK